MANRPATRHWLPGLLLTVGLTALAAFAGAQASVAARTFYTQLSRPDWAPPPWIFGPVWTALYVMMALAAWLVWRRRDAPVAGAITLYMVQLFVNGLWSWLFFAWRQGAGAFADVVLLLVLVAWNCWWFFRIRRLAGLLMVPYLAWVAFATALTYAVWQGNPGVL